MHPLCGITRITYSIEGDNTLFRGMCIACTYYMTHQQGKVLQGHHISKQGDYYQETTQTLDLASHIFVE